jgi:hypothetical protein
MQKPENPTFVIFFSLNRDAPNVRRFALLRQYLAVESRSDVKIIDHAVLTHGFYQFMIVAEAASAEILESATAHCEGIIKVKIVPVTNISANSQPAEKRYAVFAGNNPSKNRAFIRNPEQLNAAVNLHLRADLSGEISYSSVLLIEAPSISKARQYGEYLLPPSDIFCTEATSPEALLKTIEGEAGDQRPPTAETVVPTTAPADSTKSETFDSANDFTIVNLGSNPVFYAPQTVDILSVHGLPLQYYDLYTNLQSLMPQSSLTTNTGVYIWATASITQQLYFNYIGYYTSGIPSTEHDVNTPISHDCNIVPPKLFSAYLPGVTVGFDVNSGTGFHIITPLLTWLQDLLNSTKYDAPWVEDGYTGDDLAAYNYYVSQLNGVPPKSGTVKLGDVQSIYDRGCPPNINQQSFDNVGGQLVLECQNFQTAGDWFDVNGKFSIINMQIATVSANDLTSAANLMQIQDPTSNIEATLDTLFTILEAVAAVIPDVGPYVSAAIVIGWETAKAEIWQAGTTNAPIQASIANMADKLNSYLGSMEQANALNFNTIKSNWGKLQTFANGTMGVPPIISVDQFGITIDPNTGKLAPSQNYIDAIAKAWKLIIYQSLFASFHTPQCNMSIISGPIQQNPWNPDAGNYEYVYYLDCNYYDSNANLTTGFMEFDCRTDAPTEVMQLLFGSNSEFNLNPLEFFTGINGWSVQNNFNVGDIDDVYGPLTGPRLGFDKIGRFTGIS